MENEKLNNGNLDDIKDVSKVEPNSLDAQKLNQNKENTQYNNLDYDNQSKQSSDVVLEENVAQVAEQKKPMNEVERLTQYYNTKQDKPRVNAIIMMTLSIVAMIFAIVVGAFITVSFSVSMFGVDGNKFFDQNANVLTFGIAGLSGAIFYIVSGAVIILLFGLTYCVAYSYFKLFKNLKKTKQQPYYIATYNGTIKLYFLVNIIYLIAFIAITVINYQNNIKGAIPILLIVMAVLSAVLAIDTLVEIIIARISYSKYPDEKLKLEVKREAHERFKLYITNRGRDIERAKNRKRWF